MARTIRSAATGTLRLAKTKTSLRSSLLFGANGAAALLGLIGFIIVSRTLGPELFGIVTIATSTTFVLAGLTDFGIGAALTSLATPILKTDRRRVNALLRATLKIEIGIGLLILLAALVLPPLLANALGGDAALTDALRLAFVTAAALSTGAYVGAVFQTFERFPAMAVYIVGSALLKLGGVAALYFTDSINILSVVGVYALSATLSMAIGLFFVPSGDKAKPAEERKIRREFLSFGKWLLLSFIISSLMSRMDVYLLAGYKGTADVGIYGTALQLSLLFPILANSISTVLLPKLAQAYDRAQLEDFIRKGYRGLLLAALAMSPVILIAPFAIDLLFGAEYAAAGPIFQILTVSLLVAIISSPMQRVFFVLRKTSVIAAVNVVNIAVSLGLYFLLIPEFGGQGAALARSTAAVLTLLIVVIAVRTLVGRLRYGVPLTKQIK